ncbi:Bug family tripartite tricarboxylate transporter substrate binding protein [Paracraurococcus lichenis]|uniref:Tripartite tricarboxylate transporter substrate binding protein n=1 Tax=Paracraurococcus lichenis TaxID=3064888 RepID=A0ABT9E082_9PROT|nr:tripartite tricarboxylate transporter substrate binding protein [Paracraurococcus sp. LOR1-02]MDO9709571.1 tripartite tricarboxylate transporter substrate binding protein [Paracraurococcus sp. LOR1-02]
MDTSRRTLLAALPLLAAPGLLRAQPAWPSRPIRLIVPFQAGGATDVTARVIAERLGGLLGQPFVVENRAGAGGNVGADAVAKAEPDGHTLLMATIGTASINQYLYQKLAYDPQKDLAPIALVNEVANGVIVDHRVPAQSLAELIALAKRDPGGMNYGTPGNGTSGHLCGELLKARAGIDLQHVPYRGTNGVIPELLAGRLQVAVDNLPAYLPHLASGALRLLAVTSKERWFTAPDVPTVAEAGATLGLKGFEAVAWFGLQAPAKVPRPVIDAIAGATLQALGEAPVQAKLQEIGSAPRPMGPDAFARFIAAENAKWSEVVRISGAKLE